MRRSQVALGDPSLSIVPSTASVLRGGHCGFIVNGEWHESPVWGQPGWRKTLAEAQSGDGDAGRVFDFGATEADDEECNLDRKLNQALCASLRKLVVGIRKCKVDVPGGTCGGKWLPAVIKRVVW